MRMCAREGLFWLSGCCCFGSCSLRVVFCVIWAFFFVLGAFFILCVYFIAFGILSVLNRIYSSRAYFIYRISFFNI